MLYNYLRLLPLMEEHWLLTRILPPTSPVAILGSLPVPNPSEGGGLGMGSATPSRRQ